jgi:hypothetical protein
VIVNSTSNTFNLKSGTSLEWLPDLGYQVLRPKDSWSHQRKNSRTDRNEAYAGKGFINAKQNKNKVNIYPPHGESGQVQEETLPQGPKTSHIYWGLQIWGD